MSSSAAYCEGSPTIDENLTLFGGGSIRLQGINMVDGTKMVPWPNENPLVCDQILVRACHRHWYQQCHLLNLRLIEASQRCSGFLDIGIALAA